VKKQITFIGALPPPVTGMTAMNEVIVCALQNSGPVRCINWSRNKPLKGLRWKIARAWGACKSIAILLASGRRRQGEVLYYPANSSGGLYYDIVIIALAQLLRYRVVLHHHTYSYIDVYNRKMALVNRLVGPLGGHVVHCEKMRDDFLEQYPTKAEFLFVPPTVVSQELPHVSAEDHEVFTFGCMSNLTFAKGLHLATATVEQLAKLGCPVRLVLAGPCMGRKEQSHIEAAIARWPDAIEYRGPVYGEQKASFFAELDAFLFPTCYKNESWGIVLTEALSAGVPVIAYDRGCVSHIIRDECGLMIPRDAEFVPKAVELIQRWIEDKELHKQVCRHALARNKQLERDANEQLPRFVERLRKWTNGGN